MMELVRVAQATISGDFTDYVMVWHSFIYHVSSMPGVTIINSIKHEFPGGGFSGLVLLGESHAAIHTWPERGQAWIELATCGDPSAIDKFIQWKP